MNKSIFFKIKKGKMFVCLCIILAILCFSVTYAYSDVTNFSPKYGMLTVRTNFRSGPSTSSSVISVLAKGTSVKMVGETSGFYIVQLGSNQVGYVSKNYVTSSSSAPTGALTYSKITATIGSVKGNSVNLRRGPGTSFTSISKLSNGTKVKAIGTINDFYLVVTSSNVVGMIQKNYLTLGTNTTNNPATITGASVSENEQLVLNLINNYREKNGKNKLTMGVKLLKIARIKSEDMTSNNYFSHTSPTYGSPFNMMKNYGISYKSAGENIAGNPSLEGAVNAWINSSTHRENLLSNSYNYVGIGISKSSTYGYIVVAMFAGV